MLFPPTDAAVAATATATPALVCLDAFNEENVEQWFESHRWEFHNNKITKSADKYSLARAKLPKSIMDVYTRELDALFLQDDPYEALHHFIISQFGKSKWISYFELLRLPVTVEDIRPSGRCTANSKVSYLLGQIKTTKFLWQCFSSVCPPRPANK